GFFDAPNQRLQVRHVSPIVTAKDLARVPVEGPDGETPPTANGEPLRLGDIADVVEDHQPLVGDAVVDDAPGLVLVVEKLPGANTAEVTRGVEKALQELRPGLGGLTIDTGIYRPASFLSRATHDVSGLLVLAALLMVIVLA